jgi:serine/threonine-protein kinase RsbW
VLNPLNMTVFARAESAEQVRAVLRGWLAGEARQRTLEDVELVATELLANSVRHANLAPDDVLRVRVSAEGTVLHLEVEDPGRDGKPRRREPDPMHGGVGLNLVDALSLHWGVAGDDRTIVWADLPLAPGRDARLRAVPPPVPR